MLPRLGWVTGILGFAIVAWSVMAGPSGFARAADDPSGNTLLAGDLRLSEVQAALGTPASWAEWFPAVETPSYHRADAPTPGWVTGATREFRRLGADGAQTGDVISYLDIFATEDAAKARFADRNSSDL